MYENPGDDGLGICRECSAEILAEHRLKRMVLPTIEDLA